MHSRSPKRARLLNTPWQPSTVLWMMLAAEGVAIILTLALGVPHPFRYLGAVSLATQGILLATLGQLYLLRVFLGRASAIRIANLVLGLLLLNSCLLAGLTRFSFEPVVGLTPAIWGQLLLRLLGIVFVVGLLGLAAFHNHWRMSRMALQIKQAELDALQARIHPHFLFNTLNTGAALVHQQPEKAEQLLLGLADLFRAALAGPRQITLAEELELARRYAEIEQLRFGPRMHVEWDLPDPLPRLSIPTLSIQPLVENAIHHGVEPSNGCCVLQVAVKTDARYTRITVSNDLPSSPSNRAGHGVGLRAVRERVEALGGSVETRAWNGSFLVTITLPTA